MIRKLTASDYPAAIELFYALDQLHVEARPDWFLVREKATVFPQEHFEAGIADPDCLFIGAFAGETLIGLARATLWQDSGMVKNLNNVCLDNIYVLPDYRHQGVAAKLYASVEEWAAAQQAQRIELHVWDFNKDALAAYAAWDFRPQRYVLEKELNDHGTN